VLAERMVLWARDPDEYLQRACLTGLTSNLTTAAPDEIREVLRALRASPHRSVKVRAEKAS
jgi:hypothetical protein